MSSSSNSPHNPPAEEEEEEEEEGGKNEETLELPEAASPETAEKIADPIDNRQKGKEIINIVVDDRKDHAVAASAKVVSSSSSRDPKKELVLGEEDDGEGFKTPTSSDHKIPAITQCPPAPIKPRPPKLLKRKASPPSGARRSLQYDDSSTEVESIFRPVTSDQKDNVEEQESKRAKNNDDEDRRD